MDIYKIRERIATRCMVPFACDALGISLRVFPCKLCFAQALPFYHGPWYRCY